MADFRIVAREFLIVPTVTKEEHDEIVARKGRPMTQDEIGKYARPGVERYEGAA